MTVTAMTREQSRVQALADEYRARGYEVTIEPTADQLPDFLAGHRPDLIVRRGEEQLVVEVKSRSSLASEKRMGDLARRVRSHPDWSFELVVVSEGEEPAFDRSHSLQRDDILQRVDETERVCTSGFTEAALLLAWAIAEAGMRLVLQEEGIELERVAPGFVLKQAVSEGLITRADYDLLARAMEYRNRVAHGYRPYDLDPSLVQDLLRFTRGLVEPTSSSAAEGA